MKPVKESIFDKPMIYTLIILCIMVLFIGYVGKKKGKNEESSYVRRDSLEMRMDSCRVSDEVLISVVKK